MRQKDETKTKRSRATKLIALNTLFVIFGLASAFTGTAAWFQSNSTVEKTVGSFQVTALPGVEYELYYLRDFASGSKEGNWNSSIEEFAGYETPYNTPNFVKVNFDGEGAVLNDPNPTALSSLWPAHKLTFALLITSGDISSFRLTDWSETTNPAVLTADGTRVHFSWALNIYGSAYSVTKETTADEFDAPKTVAAGYHQAPGGDEYNFFKGKDASGITLVDKFTYDQSVNPSPDDDKTPISIFASAPEKGASQMTVVYFSIEFSNGSDTFYSYDKTTGRYSKSASGNSNCYELLQLNSMEFELS